MSLAAFAAVEEIARSVLYEGYLLYPYRRSALKNRRPWLFGRLLPRAWCLAHGESESWRMQCECLTAGDGNTGLEARVRFLQLTESGDANERAVTAAASLDQMVVRPHQVTFAFERSLEGSVTLSASEAGPGIFKLTAVIENLSVCAANRELGDVIGDALLSTHAILRADKGTFFSLIDPPEAVQLPAAGCRNAGTWPVLVGPTPGEMMLAAPIILYDYPTVAPESPGDLFDGTEIDELLSLRIQTLTDDEQREMAGSGARTQTMLERTLALSEEQRRQLHGRLKTLPANSLFRPGDRVRLRPARRADALDMVLAGQKATVVSVERDFEDGIHLSVVIDEDPGRDFGRLGLPGHRFFFRPEEVERLDS